LLIPCLKGLEGISGGYKSDQCRVGYELIEQNNALPGTHRTSSQLQQQSANAEQKRDLEELDRVIDSITRDFSRPVLNARLKALARKSPNAATIVDHILAEQMEGNIKSSTAESKIKVLLWLSKYYDDKPFQQLSKQEILGYLNSLRKPTSADPLQKWIGSYNNRLRYYAKFFRWLYNQDEPDYQKRKTPPCIRGLRQLARADKSSYKPSDLWDGREHAVFLRYCPSARDRCYHAMANDMSARPRELLNLKIKDIVFKVTEEEGIQYAEVLIRGGKTKPRTLPMIDSIPYLKEWLRQHPSGGNPNSWLFVSLADGNLGEKLNRDSLLAKYQYQYQYKAVNFPRLLQDETVSEADKAVIRNLLTKPWNLYVFRHSALTEKSQILTESTLRDHAGWTMSSKMPTTYIHYFGSESSKKLLEAKGIIKHGDKALNVLKSKQCPHCTEPNKPDAQFCAKCKMVLNYDSYRIVMEEKCRREDELKSTRQEMNQKFAEVIAWIQQNPELGQVKPEVLVEKKIEN
jgi:integrase